jgi:hypothetical protein
VIGEKDLECIILMRIYMCVVICSSRTLLSQYFIGA